MTYDLEPGDRVRVAYRYGDGSDIPEEGSEQERVGTVVKVRADGSGFTFDHSSTTGKFTSVLDQGDLVRVYSVEESPDWAPREYHHVQDLNKNHAAPNTVEVEPL